MALVGIELETLVSELALSSMTNGEFEAIICYSSREK